MQRIAMAFALGAVLGTACHGSSSTTPSPVSPTVTVPAGCTGSAISGVQIGFFAGGQDNGVNVQVFGKTVNQQLPSGQLVNVTESVVPCAYEIVGQMLGRSLGVQFG